MKKSISITLENGQKVTCPSQTLVGELLHDAVDSESGLPYLGALVNNELVTFGYTLDIDSSVRFITMASAGGMQIYARSLSFLLAKAVKDLHPAARFSVEHALGPGLYCEFEINGSRGISPDQAAALEAHMRDLVAANRPIVRQRISYTAAIEKFTRNGQDDKVSLLRFTNTPKIVTYVCENFSDLATGPMTRSTGPLRFFRLIPYQTGFVLQMPTRESAPESPNSSPSPSWRKPSRNTTAGAGFSASTPSAASTKSSPPMKSATSSKSPRPSTKRRSPPSPTRSPPNPSIKWMLIAGPSSSGKTTFAKRLAIQLRVNGLRPVTLGTDDYFVDREHTPLTPSGEFDFEHLHAVDVPTLNHDLAELDAGREIQRPTFDFHTGARLYKGKTLRLDDDQVVVLEGIHSLNPELTSGLPAARKFHIYISALTQLNLDNNNRIPTTDNRLLRRLVRDHRYRGHSATRTLEMWPNVGRGERTWIFPFQEEADAVFNSALDYELAILSVLARPLLSEIKPHQPVYAEARRMLEFLAHFIPLSTEVPPPVSIIREFVGGSDFDY
jgi:uridine kinase